MQGLQTINMRYTLAITAFVIWSITGVAQKYIVDKSLVSFYSDGAIEDITADNKKAAGIFNSSNNEIVFSIPISEFQFAKSLMQEHFNEKYMETDKFPKSSFQGTISNFDPAENNVQQVTASGKLSIHGVVKEVSIPGKIQRQGDKLLMNASMLVKLADYNIEIPQLLWQNIAEQVEVKLDFTFKPQK
jgi:polyisoprenoid-binding protein YceI